METRSHGLPSLLAILGAAFAACSAPAEAPRVTVATSLAVPRSLLTKVTKLSVSILEGEITCDPATGAVTKGAGAVELVPSRALGSTGCAGGAKFCGDVTIAPSEAARVFAATGADGTDATVAAGCATATVSTETASVSIKMVRYLAPAKCGDRTIQPTEQCDPGGSAVCDASCQSSELLLSIGNASNRTSTGSAGDKADPFFLWPAGSDAAGLLYAFYTDRATGLSNDVDVGMRVLDADLSPLSSPPAPVAFATASLFLPNGSNGGVLPPDPDARQQSRPRAALLGGKIWVVFQDDNTAGSNGLDVHARSMDASGVADQPANTPLGVNGASGAGELGIQQAPSVAASRGKLFVAWEDAASGSIAGRTITPPATMGNQNELSAGTGNTRAAVAPTSTGWIVVWQSGTGIKLRALNEDGTPQGAEASVSEGAAAAEAPRVASLADGRFAVTWSTGGDVFVQRYDERGAKIPGDQAAPIHDVATAGAQTSPAIAAAPSAGGSYVVAWLDGSGGHVRARMLGGSSGFLFNNVNGQASEFQASRADGRTRAAPAVAVGGSGPFVVIGWEDKTSPGAGVVARRFPLPSD